MVLFGMVYATPDIIASAAATWLHGARYVAIGDRDDAEAGIVSVPVQNFVGASRSFLRRPNHSADNRPLTTVRLANESCPTCDWIAIGDADTYWNRVAIETALACLNPRQPWLLGLPRSPDYAPSRCLASNGCCALGSGGNCTSVPFSRDYYGRGLHRPVIWPFGGAGYVLSRGLLDRIARTEWADCEARIRDSGGDVRVASCIFSKAGVGLTHLPLLLTHLSSHQVPPACPTLSPSRADFWRRQLDANRDPWDRKRTSLRHHAQPLDSPLFGGLALLDYADYGVMYANATVIKRPAAAADHNGTRPRLAFIHGWVESKHAPALAELLHLAREVGGAWNVVVMSPRDFPHESIRRIVVRAHTEASETLRFWAPNPGAPFVQPVPRGIFMPGVTNLFPHGDRKTRPTLLYCGGINVRSHSGRRGKLDALSSNGFHCDATKRLASHNLAREYRRSMFVASPREAGKQNFREWEAMALGAIPLIDVYDDKGIFDKLPVIRVQNWSMITPTFLEAEWRRISRAKYDLSVLRTDYWRKKLGLCE